MVNFIGIIFFNIRFFELFEANTSITNGTLLFLYYLWISEPYFYD